MDAQTLFRDGVQALRDQQDAAKARQLLTQSLKLDPNNEMAWLWLSRTTNDPQKKLQCVERALRINPNNPQALALRDKLKAPALPSPSPASKSAPSPKQSISPFSEPLDEADDPPPSAFYSSNSSDDLRAALNQYESEPEPEPIDDSPQRARVIPVANQKEINTLLAQADQRLKAGDEEGAVEAWVRVLEMQVDQPVAIQNAVKQLFKMGYKDDASELIWRAINAGTTSIPIYMTAIDLARVQGEPGKADEVREKVALLPNADEALMLKMVDHFLEIGQMMRAEDLLQKLIVVHPDSQALFMRLGDMEDQMGHKARSMQYYEHAARLKGSGGKQADKVLSNFTPVITDRERGSVLLAFREAVGFGAVYLLMGWQDAGLNLLRMGSQRWLGVLLSIAGGYLLVTALSAPQQKPLAGWLGGRVPKTPEPPPTLKKRAEYEEADPTPSGAIQEPTYLPILPMALRFVFAVVGIIVLIGAFMLVFNVSIQLLQHPVTPTIPRAIDLFSEQP